MPGEKQGKYVRLLYMEGHKLQIQKYSTIMEALHHSKGQDAWQRAENEVWDDLPANQRPMSPCQMKPEATAEHLFKTGIRDGEYRIEVI